MITVSVEKEIKQENKVVKSFTMRQVAFMGAALTIAAIFYFLARPDASTAMGFGACMGTLAWYFGFHKKNGLPVEYFLWKKIKTVVLMNFSRRYRTRNMYITMLNRSYQDDLEKDLQDKKKARIIKNRRKQREHKRSKIRAYR